MDERDWAVLTVTERALTLFLENGALDSGTSVLTSGGLTYRLTVGSQEECALAIFNAGVAGIPPECRLLEVHWKAAGPRRIEFYEPGKWEDTLPRP